MKLKVNNVGCIMKFVFVGLIFKMFFCIKMFFYWKLYLKYLFIIKRSDLLEEKMF